ncbi:MAG: T9SS type A sorting domain-containing protein, partial [Cyclobacteriaceae bacterium]
GNYVSLRTGEASVEFDDLKVFKSRNSGNVTVTVSNFNAANYGGDARFAPPNGTDPSCKVKSYVKDASDNWSNFGNLDVRVNPCATCRQSVTETASAGLMPNPIEAVSRLNYTLTESGKVAVRITDISGRVLTTVLEDTKDRGTYEVEVGSYFQDLAAGIYLIRLETGKSARVIRAVKR